MSTMVPLYGFGGGSGGNGAALTVNAPAGVTVTVSKDGKSKKKTANSSGIAVFKGLSTGEWTVTITDGEKTASKPVTIIADFNTKITFFSATIHVTYPAGSTCTATDGVTTLTAPDTSGTWDCVVENAGLWTVSLGSGFAETIDVTTSGETYTIDRWYLYNQGDEHEAITGGWWKNENYKWENSSDSRPNTGTVSFDNDSIFCSVGSGKSAFASTQKKISLQGFTTIKAMLTIVNRGIFALMEEGIVYVSKASAKLDTSSSVTNNEFALDIGTLQDAYVAIGTIGKSSVTRSVTIYKVWLEV